MTEQETHEQQRARLIEDVRKVLLEGMQKAEREKNWEVFTRYADAYRKLVG